MGAFDGSIGAFMMGTLFATLLTGITVTQAFYYYVNFPNDRRLYFWLVTVLLVIDIFHTIISWYTIYHWCVTNFGNLAVLVHSPWSFSIEPVFTAITASIVQSFYAYRVFIVSGRKLYIPVTILFFSAIQLGFGIGATAKIYVLDSEFARFPEWTYGVTIWLVSAAIADIIITASLIYYLAKVTGDHERTHSIAHKIVRNTIGTNGLCSCVALIDAILFIVKAQNWHVFPQLTLVKLYYNAVLVSLNSRQKIVEPSSGSFGTRSYDLTYNPKSHMQKRPTTPVPIIISMTETRHMEVDQEKDMNGVNKGATTSHHSGESCDSEAPEPDSPPFSRAIQLPDTTL